MNKAFLIDFESKVANEFNSSRIRAPIHLHGGNEDQLIKIFSKITHDDWVFTSWRSHYHCLLKGVDPKRLMSDICDGKSITLVYPDHRIYSSAIVAGVIPIALGTALGIKKLGRSENVYLFVGEMTAETGAMMEAHKYAVGHELPITFIIEDNTKSVCTDTSATWSLPTPTLKGSPKVIYYTYDLPWPHAGAGVRVQF